MGSTYTNIGTIQRRLAWPLRKDDTQIREAFRIFRGRSAPPRGRRRRSPRGDPRGCQLNRLLRKWKRSQKRRRERINLQTKKVQTKGKRGAKGKQAEVANQETKEDLPAENGETKNEESPASDEAEEKEAKSD